MDKYQIARSKAIKSAALEQNEVNGEFEKKSCFENINFSFIKELAKTAEPFLNSANHARMQMMKIQEQSKMLDEMMEREKEFAAIQLEKVALIQAEVEMKKLAIKQNLAAKLKEIEAAEK